MNAQQIRCFLESTENLFSTMLSSQVEFGRPELEPRDAKHHDVSGIIAMSGDVEGTICLSFPTATAERLVCLFTGMELASDHEDFADAIGELVNMVSGNAQAQFEGKHVTISCPSVVIGPEHQVYGRKDVICIQIPCETDAGDFTVEVSIRHPAAQAAEAA